MNLVLIFVVNAILYFSSKSKIDPGCGWPAFESFPSALKKIPDPDGIRTEIEYANSGHHLGHEFNGELLTRKNVRKCVNSLPIQVISEGKRLTPTDSG
jgi:peptide-methionine (R)-S-oxide reductase